MTPSRATMRRIPLMKANLGPVSSEAERPAFNRVVVGSIPTPGVAFANLECPCDRAATGGRTEYFSKQRFFNLQNVPPFFIYTEFSTRA